MALSSKRFFVAAVLSLVAAGVFAGCSSEARLVNVAKKDSHSGTRKMAVEGLTEQASLVEVAKDSKYGLTRMQAAERLDERYQAVAQATYADLARSRGLDATSVEGRRAAVHKLTDPKRLARVAKKSDDPYVRQVATQKLARMSEPEK